MKHNASVSASGLQMQSSGIEAGAHKLLFLEVIIAQVANMNKIAARLTKTIAMHSRTYTCTCRCSDAVAVVW